MDENTVFIKTERGREEIRTRAAKLGGQPRALLIAVDGVKSTATLSREYPVAGGIGILINELLQQGLIETGAQSRPATAAVDGTADSFERFRQATQFLNETSSLLGLGGYLFSLKIQRCGNLAELAALGPELRAALVKKRGDQEAEALMRRFHGLVG